MLAPRRAVPPRSSPNELIRPPLQSAYSGAGSSNGRSSNATRSSASFIALAVPLFWSSGRPFSHPCSAHTPALASTASMELHRGLPSVQISTGLSRSSMYVGLHAAACSPANAVSKRAILEPIVDLEVQLMCPPSLRVFAVVSGEARRRRPSTPAMKIRVPSRPWRQAVCLSPIRARRRSSRSACRWASCRRSRCRSRGTGSASRCR